MKWNFEITKQWEYFFEKNDLGKIKVGNINAEQWLVSTIT